MNSGGGSTTPLGAIAPERVKALGDGFYLADGWVLSEDDLAKWRIAVDAADAR